MNYAGKFGSGELDSHSAASVDIDSLSHRGDADTVTIPDAHLLFSGDFQRSGADLIVSDHDHRVVVPNYFQGDKRATLVSPDGAPLDPKVVEALTGHVQYAQAAGTAAAVKVVGHVVKMTGSASVVRNGVTVTLNEGDTVLQNDVVQTGSGSTLGLVMIDGTTFNLSAGARLMLNDLTYDANSTSNTSLFTLVQGAASFVAGQVAKTGDMKVGTPAATMGIRGTAVVLDISAVDGTVSISVIDQRDGQIHAVQVFNSRGVLIGTVSSNGAGLTLTPIANFDVIARASDKTPAQIAQEFNVFQQALQLYQIQKAIDPTLPQHTENAPGDANPQQTKYAGPAGSTPPSPVDTPATTLPPAPVRTATAEATPATTTVVLTQQPAAGPAGTPPPSTPDPITFHIPVQTAQLPFVINTSTVPQISSGAGDHFGPVMSASGDVVYDPDGIIYFYDRETGATIRVTPAGDGFSYSGQTVSSDGRYIAYQGTNGTDTFVYIYGTDPSDTLHYHQQVKLVAGTSPAVSGDGSTILVEHGGSIGIHNLHGDLLGTITAAAAGVSGTVWKPAISADGHVVAFWSSDGAAAGGAGHLFTYDLSTGNITEIASTAAGAGSSAASFSADGRYVVYQSDAPGGHSEIYLYDLSAGQVIFHTENATGASYNPVISSDGDFIVFASRAALTPGDTNAFADTYTVDVRDPANPLYKLVSAGPDGKAGDADSDRGAAIGAGGIVVFGSNASNFSNDPDGGEGDIFISDPTSGRSAIIYQTATSPSTLHAEGVIALTGASSDRTGITLTVVDPLGNPTSLVTANFNANGDIVWNFDEARTADSIASLAYGQDFSQHFLIRQSAGGITTDTPVTITVHNGVQPTVTVVDVAPGALPVTLAQGTEDTSFTITAAALLAGVGDIDTPLSQLHITNVTIKSGGGSLTANENGTWTYTPAADFNGAVAFNYTVSDGTKTASSTASLHVAAVNDVATIDGNASGNVVEDSSTTASGALTVHDVDSGQNHFQAVSGAALVGTYGNFTFNANTGTWTYALDHTRADSLAAGQLVHDKLTVTSADGTASQVIDVAVVGSAETPGSDVTRLTFDDLPAVSSSGSVVPDGYGGLDWSNFNYLNSTTSYPVSGYTHGTVSGPNVAYNSFAQTATVSGATFNFIGADLTGAWNNGLSITVTGFNHGVLVDQETVVVDTNNPTWFEFDFNGITDLVFTSSGGVDAGYGGFGMHFAMDNFEYSASANNAATIAGDAAGSLVEDDTSTDASGNVIAHDIESGTLTVHDVDSGESHFRAVVPATLAGHYGNFTFNENTGAWTYTLVHAQADSLTAGQLVHDTLTVRSVDGTASQVIDVAITGSNDAPVAVADTGVSITQNGGVGVSFSPILNAHATGVGSEYVITQAVNSQAGALWSNSKVSLNTSFTISADLFFGANDGGADGFSFIIQNQSKNLIGASGGGLGYQGIANSVAIEFDTYDNGAGSNDIPHDHAAFDVNGSMNGIGAPIDLGNIEDNQYHPVTIDWNAATHVITLSYNGHVIGSQTIDVAAIVGSGEAYIGFAGSTGAANNLQMIRDLTYQSTDDSVVLDVLVNDTDVDAGDKATLHVVSAASAKGASVTFSGLPGAGIVYSPGRAFDYLAAGQTTTDTVTYTIRDSHGAESTTTAEVTINGLNDAPTLTAAAANPEASGLGTQADPVKMFSSAHSSTIDAGQTITGLTFGVSGLVDGANEKVVVDGTTIALGSATTGSTSSGLTYSVTIAGGTATVALSSAAGISAADADTLVNNVAYQDTSADAPTAGDRTFTLTEIADSGGTSNTTALSIASTVHLEAVNDAPVFTGQGSVAYIAGDAAVVVTSGDVIASDVDSNNYAGGSFTATVTNGGGQGDTLSIAQNAHISIGTLGSGHIVMYDADGPGGNAAISIGELANNAGHANSVSVSLNNNATDAAVEALAQAIQFQNGKSDTAAGARTVTFTLQDGGGTANGGHNSDFFTATVNVAPPPPPSSKAPAITGDLSVVAVKGASVAITAADLSAIDADSQPNQLVYTVTDASHGHVAAAANGPVITSFTQAQLDSGAVFFVADGTSYTGQGSFTVALSDGINTAPTSMQVGVSIVDAEFRVLTTGGYNFVADDPITAMGRGYVDSDVSNTFTITDANFNREFVFNGSGFVFDRVHNAFTAGTITDILERDATTHQDIASFGVNVSAAAWYNAVYAQAHGDGAPFEALTGPWTFNFIGNAGADSFSAANANDIFTGRAGNDAFSGDFGYDRAYYGGNAGPVLIALALGTVYEFSSGPSPVLTGTDTLRSIEMVTGTNYSDIFDATNFGTIGSNVGSKVTGNADGLFNEFEGRGGDDLIAGNGQTRISYYHATSGVTVTFNSWTSATSGASGTQTGDASVGNDHFSGVNSVRGSFFSDTLTGSTNPFGTGENFEGLGGGDAINGGGGFDRAVYSREEAGLVFNMAAGTVLLASDSSNTGDTLRSIEAIWGTDLGDTYDASNFSTSSANAGSAQFSAGNSASTNFNEFEGGGGNDTVIGNGNTRVAFYHATGGVVVTLGPDGSGTADGDASVGHDTFTGSAAGGVTRVRGSEFNDIFTGNGANNTLEGQGGNGSDIFVYDGAGNDRISDFNRADADRIDLRAFSSIHSVGQLVVTQGTVNSIENSTIIAFDGATLSLQGYDSVAHPLQAGDFIFAGQVAVTVQTGGYDFSSLYHDLAVGYAGLAAGDFALSNNATHMFLVDAAKGITFELIGTDFAYNGGHLPISGTIAEVNVLYTTNPADPTELTQDHLLVNSDGWNLDAASLISYVGQYTQNPHGAGLDGLDGIFGAASYNYVGGSFFNYAPSTGYDGLLQAGGLTSVFVASDHPDVFNGIPPTPYVLNPSPGTVDYSHTQTGGVTVDLQTGFTSGFAAAGDIFVSIDGLRGTDSADHLTGGDGWNVLEGGLGDDTLDGGAGSIGDIVSYQHATPGVGNIGVTVNLALQGTSQNTVQAGSDTLTNFRDILGSAGNDTLIGDGNDNFLIGGEGADALHGGGGIDIADYELASTGVTVSLAQPGLNTGEAAGDTYDSIESVTGSHFNDVLAGNSGNNTLWGLDGNDTFVFNATTGSGQDTIGDFVQGRDHIQLDYLAFTPGNTASFDAWAAGHVTQQSTGVLIDLNADGHHAGQDTIRLSFTPIVLSMNDFILAPGHP